MEKGIICAAAASVIFGLNPALISLALERGITPENMVFWMNLSNGLANVFLYRIRGRQTKPEDRRRWLLPLMATGALGIGGTGYMLALSYRQIGTGISTVIHFMYPVIVSGVMAVCWREGLGGKKLLAMALSVFGIVLLTGKMTGGGSLIDYVPALLSSLTYSFYMIRSGGDRWRDIPVSEKCGWMCAGVCLAFGSLQLVRGSFACPPSREVWLLIVMTGVSSAAAYNALVYGIGIIGPSQAAFATLLEPLTSMAVSVLVYGEIFTGRIAAGSVMILLAVFLNTRRRAQRDGVAGAVCNQRQKAEGEGA